MTFLSPTTDRSAPRAPRAALVFLLMALALPSLALAEPVPVQKPAGLAATSAPTASTSAPSPEAMPATRAGSISETAAAVAAETSDGETLDVTDADENYNLPPYPAGARVATGKMQTYTVEEEDTFLDIARHFGLGYVELRAANPGIDPWAPTPGEELVIPTFNLLPRAKQEGIVINLGDMRMYYFKKPGAEPLSYALGIGREGLATPTGETTVVRKAAHPSWYPTPRMREEKPWLPAAVPPGPANPLGTHALYLGWPTFLIHGSNKPWGIGRRVSSGCVRMYPEDIITLFDMVPTGTKVTVVDQPILVGWLDDGLYIEANPSKTQANEIEIDGVHTLKPLTPTLRGVIVAAAGPEHAGRIDWSAVDKAVRERRGYPVLIARKAAPAPVDTSPVAPKDSAAGSEAERPARRSYVPASYN